MIFWVWFPSTIPYIFRSLKVPCVICVQPSGKGMGAGVEGFLMGVLGAGCAGVPAGVMAPAPVGVCATMKAPNGVVVPELSKGSVKVVSPVTVLT